MERGEINTLMIALMVVDVIFLLALLRGSRLASDYRQILLFLLNLVK